MYSCDSPSDSRRTRTFRRAGTATPYALLGGMLAFSLIIPVVFALPCKMPVNVHPCDRLTPLPPGQNAPCRKKADPDDFCMHNYAFTTGDSGLVSATNAECRYYAGEWQQDEDGNWHCVADTSGEPQVTQVQCQATNGTPCAQQ
jgi:hypothetical protein